MEALPWIAIVLIAVLMGVLVYVVFIRGPEEADKKIRRPAGEMGDEMEAGPPLRRMGMRSNRLDSTERSWMEERDPLLFQGERPRVSRVVTGVLVYLALAALLAALIGYFT